ncbi:protein O-mannosyl-transferase TMTC4 [Bemisia tabaci]|uniref:protein O-mannosyl-transferase TMTC4 n=1 Tax=Bemisia tabaci TaxID=7038 RepID=UPI003B28108D
MAMLAKETGLTVLFVNLFLDLYRSWHPLKRALLERKWNEEALHFSQRTAKLLMALSVLLVFRLALLQGSLPRFVSQDNPAAFHPHRQVRLLTFSYLAVFNFLLLLCPSTLSHDWQMGSIPLVASFSDSRNIGTCILIALSLVLAYKCFVDFEEQKQIPLVLSCLLLVLPFLPAANILVTVGFVIAERVLYIPSSGFVLLVAYGVQLMCSRATHKQKSLICSVIILVLCCFAAKTHIRNKDWASRETLSRSGLRAVPQNAKMHYNWANCLRDKNESREAVLHYREALALWPQYASAHNNLGTLMSNPSVAEHHFLTAIQINPTHVNAHYNLGQIYRRMNRTTEAMAMLERCLSLNSEYTPAYLLLAKLHAGPIAGRLLRHVALLAPHSPDHAAYYAAWLAKHNRILEAQRYYEDALSISFSHLESLLGLARCLRSRGQKSRLQQILLRWHIQQGNIEVRWSGGSLPGVYAGDLYLGSWELYKQGQVTSVSETRQDAFVYCINEGLPHSCKRDETRTSSSESTAKSGSNITPSSDSKSFQ